MTDRFSRAQFHVMAKPIGPICNLDCEYCYYLHKEDLYQGNKQWRMTPPTLDRYIQQYIEAQPASAPEITFAWQGGEPTLLGLEFFERIVQLQQLHARSGQKIVNTLQTNGVLLDESWAEFFKKHRFLIGLSIDGPAELHDAYRYDKKGEGTFAKVLGALKLLRRFQVEFNVLVVVNRVNSVHGKRVYTYLRDSGAEFLQFIPIVERRGVGVHPESPLVDDATSPNEETQWDALVSSRSVRPHQFGRFLIEVFDEWLRRDVGRVFVQTFDQALAAWLGHEPSLCIFRKQCGRALAFEHNGDVYSCDHFVEPEYKLGNIHELPLIELVNSPDQRSFAAAKETTLPQYCRDCEVLHVCNGECPKNRFIETPMGESGLNYLCSGYRAFFSHSAEALQQMAVEVRSGRPAANVMRQRQHAGKQKRPVQSHIPGRNDLCPCGSSRKFKKCCGRR